MEEEIAKYYSRFLFQMSLGSGLLSPKLGEADNQMVILYLFSFKKYFNYIFSLKKNLLPFSSLNFSKLINIISKINLHTR